MDSFFCRTSSCNSASTAADDLARNVVRSEEITLENFDKTIDNWKIPKVNKEDVYKSSFFDFRMDFTIKTEEQDVQLIKPFETIQLLTETSLEKHRLKNYKYINIGLVQVGIKPLTKEGLNTSILAVLRDARFTDFEDSLLSSVESSLCTGPISFDCHPNLTISLNDKNILNSLILQIKTHNYRMLRGSIPVAIIYRVHYKAMTSAFATKVRFQSKKGETLLLQTDLSRANTVVPRSIQWKEITLPDEWLLEGATQSESMNQLTPNSHLRNITQYQDGKVSLSFNRIPRQLRFIENASTCDTIDLGRVSQIGSHINLGKSSRFDSQSDLGRVSRISSHRYSTSDIPSSSFRNVDYSTDIPKPVYINQKRAEPELEPTSPTFSSISENVINELNTLKINFNIDNKYLRDEFYAEENLEKRLWFFQKNSKNKNIVQKEFYKFLQDNESHVFFFDWFENFYVPENSVEYPFLETETKSTIQRDIFEKLVVTDISKLNMISQDSDNSSDSCQIQNPNHQINKVEWEHQPQIIPSPDLNIVRPVSQSRFNAATVYDWNINGKSEYEILNVLQQMTMAANAYKTQTSTQDSTIAEILIAGFSGQLKGWWDYYLTDQQHEEILEAIKTDENNVAIIDENGYQQQDAVSRLILTISLHFIGDPSLLKDKNAELLSNLRCKKLSDFQIYKNTFLTRVMLREDSNQAFWKEKFLAGLPSLLGEKVRTQIRNSCGKQIIPYEEFTYGQLVSIIQQEGLNICQNLKLQKNLKWELKNSKLELGSFCHQFEINTNKPKIDCTGECSRTNNRSNKQQHKFRNKNSNYKSKEEYYRKPKYKYPNNQNNKEWYRNAECFKCHKTGHTARYCKLKNKLNELHLGKEITEKISSLLVNSSDSELSDSSKSPHEKSSPGTQNSSESENHISVLTRDQELHIEIIKSLNDPVLQKEYVDKLFNNQFKPLNKTPTNTSQNIYDLTKILRKTNNEKKDSKTEFLQKELAEIKLEIRELNDSRVQVNAAIDYIVDKIDRNDEREFEPEENANNTENSLFFLKEVTSRKYLIKITLCLSETFKINTIALFDTGADLNCIKTNLVPLRFRHKTSDRLSAANNSKLFINFKTDAAIEKEDVYLKSSFVLIDNISHTVILGTPFINLITPYVVKTNSISFKINEKDLQFEFLEKSSFENKKNDSQNIYVLCHTNESLPMQMNSSEEIRYNHEKVLYKNYEQKLLLFQNKSNKLMKDHQDLIDELLISNYEKDHFLKKTEILEWSDLYKTKFPYFVILKGIMTGVFKTWSYVKTYTCVSDSIFYGFYTAEAAIKFAKENLGDFFYTESSVEIDLNTNYKRRLDDELSTTKKTKIGKEKQTEGTRKSYPNPTLFLLFPHQQLKPLPKDIIDKIFEKAKNNFERREEEIHSFLKSMTHHKLDSCGLCIYNQFHHNKVKQCHGNCLPSHIPICQCTIDFSISKCAIDLQKFQLTFPNGIAHPGGTITPQTLLDYGLVEFIRFPNDFKILENSFLGNKLKSLINDYQHTFKLSTDPHVAWIFINFSSKPPEWIGDHVEPAKHIILFQGLQTKFGNNYISGGGYTGKINCNLQPRDQINRWRSKTIADDLREGLILQTNQWDSRLVYQNFIYKIYIELPFVMPTRSLFTPFPTSSYFPELIKWYKIGEKEELAKRLKNEFPQSWWNLDTEENEEDQDYLEFIL